jgi:MinD-like ATPase involved in chromosome partitioning or flagellar assembly
MTTSVVVALPGEPREAALVAALGHPTQRLHVARRCVDVADLIAVCASGTVGVALIGGPLLPVDGGVVARIQACGVGVVALARDAHEAARLSGFAGVRVVGADASIADIVEALRNADHSGRARPAAFAAAGTPGDQPPAAPAADTHHARPSRIDADSSGTDAVDGGERAGDVVDDADRSPGEVVAVWGPTGAPGRSSLAAILAQEIARGGSSACLLDVDTYGPSLDQVLGLLGDRAPGLIQAVRQAHRGETAGAGAAACAVRVEDRLDVLTGLARADRWPEVRPAALETVIEQVARHYAYLIADVGFCLEQDEELAYDTLAPRRNGAALSVIARADRIVAVCAAEPVGIRRLLHGLDTLADLEAPGRIEVLLNRAPVRGGAALAGDVAELLAEHGHPLPVHAIADDPRGFVAWRAHGGTFAEHAPRSPVRGQVQSMLRAIGALPGERAQSPGKFRAPLRRTA